MTHYRFASRPEPEPPPALDESQRAVVEHDGGPLLVLAGPGTGKTTTLVESVVDLVDRRGVAPSSVLVLTFGRKAAEQLRDRISARLGRTLIGGLASTFHSFAYALIRAHTQVDLFSEPLHLLSSAERDVAVRTLLGDTPEAVPWPDGFALARGTRGFATEVGGFLDRARERGVDPHDLAGLGSAHDRPSWESAARFFEQYLDVLDAEGALDYAGLIDRAGTLLDDPEVLASLRTQYTHVFVDEYQDTDPGQVALLRRLAGDGRHLVVVGDPDQSIYGFRGADVAGILRFPDEFRSAAGAPAPVVALGTTRRFGPVLLGASRRLADGLGVSGPIPASAVEAFRHPASVVAEAGSVEVRLYDNDRAELDHIADLLRRAHLEDGVPWSEMAVLVRSGTRTIPAARRALVAAGVPVATAREESSLVTEPATAVLLESLRVALAASDEPGLAARAVGVLLSPLGGSDATVVRSLGRSLVASERVAAKEEARRARTSEELVGAAVLDPGVLDGSAAAGAEAVRGLGTLLARVRHVVGEGATAEEALWELWSGSAWSARLRRAALDRSTGVTSILANRDLDAVSALFEAAARAEHRRGHTGVGAFVDSLAAQELPADSLAETGLPADGVRLMTAHRSKGLEWRLVVVAHVQHGGWPDLRSRSTLLRVDELGVGELLPPLAPRTLLAEERRLFYVACTRARERLVVTAVKSLDDDGEQPSRFLHELVDDDRHQEVSGRPARSLSLDALVAELRRVVCDPEEPDDVRRAAADRLARLAVESVAGRPIAPAAHPDRWWGLASRTVSGEPLIPEPGHARVSASDLNAMVVCPAKWFLERHAGGGEQSTTSQEFGTLVHAIAEAIGRGEVEVDDDLMVFVDRVWPQFRFDTPWASDRERTEAEEALRRFAAWHTADRGRELLGVERSIRASVQLPDGRSVDIHGYADRLELDLEGRVVTVDLKTSKGAPSEKDAQTHPQLGLYQLAVDRGAVDDLRPDARSGGAELIQLRQNGRSGSVKVVSQQPQQPDDEGWLPVERQIAEAVDALSQERFSATPGEHCRWCSFNSFCPAKTEGRVLT